MAVIEMVNRKYKTKSAMKRVIDYVCQETKTDLSLMKGYNVNPTNAYEEFYLNKLAYDKAKENGMNRFVIHFVQSFAPTDPVTPELANEIAGRLLENEQFKGFKVLYATHTDKGHIHNHFILDTVNMENGCKWQLSKQQLEENLKKVSDRICEEYGLSVITQKNSKNVHKSRGRIEAEKEGRSYVKEIQLTVDMVMQVARNREDFIRRMNRLGYSVLWKDERKYITFTDKDGNKVRNSRFENNEEYTKDRLMQRFMENEAKWEAAERDRELAEQLNEVEQILIELFRTQTPYPLQKVMNNQTEDKQAKKEMAMEYQKGRGIEW